VTWVNGNNFSIYRGNNRDAYSIVSQNKVNHVITDPPYGDTVHSEERVARDDNRQVSAVPLPFDKLSHDDICGMAQFCETFDGWALIFCQTEQISHYRSVFEGRTLNRIRYFRPMVWIKPDAKPNLRGNGPGIGHETIQAYWCGKEAQRWNGGGKVGVFHHTRNRRTDGSFKHPTEKPVPLMKELVRLFTNPGDTIFDPFMGCGSTGVAAVELGRKFIGIERDEKYFNEAHRRLREAASPNLLLPADPKIPTLFGDPEFGSWRRKARQAKEKTDADR
jgi:site-specific DNA-methyltransferase (adenine-specific)